MKINLVENGVFPITRDIDYLLLVGEHLEQYETCSVLIKNE
jgi:hypothetical protein